MALKPLQPRLVIQASIRRPLILQPRQDPHVNVLLVLHFVRPGLVLRLHEFKLREQCPHEMRHHLAKADRTHLVQWHHVLQQLHLHLQLLKVQVLRVEMQRQRERALNVLLVLDHRRTVLPRHLVQHRRRHVVLAQHQRLLPHLGQLRHEPNQLTLPHCIRCRRWNIRIRPPEIAIHVPLNPPDHLRRLPRELRPLHELHLRVRIAQRNAQQRLNVNLPAVLAPIVQDRRRPVQDRIHPEPVHDHLQNSLVPTHQLRHPAPRQQLPPQHLALE